MRFRLGLTAPVAMAAFLIALVACGDDSTLPAAGGLNTPDIQATVTALAQSQAQALTATPVPQLARIDLLAFQAGHRSTADEWNSFHQAMDQWREGLAACVPSSVESALDAFAGSAIGISQTARGLDRLLGLETMAARLTLAAEKEATAFETLSSNWTPEIGLSGSSDLFQSLATARSAADMERGTVTRSLLAMQNGTDEATRNLIEVFSAQMATLDLDWDAFHRNYDSFRAAQLEVKDGDDKTPNPIGGLLSQFGIIVDRVRTLPDTDVTREISQRLAGAADGEQLLLRRILGSIGGNGTLTESVAVLPQDLAITETVNGDGSINGNDGANASSLTLSGATIFDVFDTQISLVNVLRRTLRNDLDDARTTLSESGQERLSKLQAQTRTLSREWDGFHDSYDEWRRTNGGCDQGQALDALGQLAADFGQTVEDIRTLPSGPLVRGMGETLLQAAEREQAAVQALRETWRYLDTSALGRYSADRSFAETLRRQRTGPARPSGAPGHSVRGLI
jgi:hypothetical protein